MKASEILRLSLSNLNNGDNWCQGKDMCDGNTMCCSSAAMSKIAVDKAGAQVFECIRDIRRARKYLLVSAGVKSEHYSILDLVKLNDVNGRTFPEIKAFFEQAIELAESKND